MLKILDLQESTIRAFPDEKALNMYKSDKERYRILEGGFLNFSFKQLTKDEAIRIVNDFDNRKLKENIQYHMVKKKPVRKKKYDENTLKIEELTKRQLVGILHRLDARADINEQHGVLLARLKSIGIL